MPVLGIRAARESIRYGFAVGRVRVLETRVFGLATYERLLDAPTFAEQLRILSDTVYGSYLEGVETPAEVEIRLDEALEDFYAFLGESNLPDPVVRYFRVRHDFANLKAALKAEILGVSLQEMLTPSGTIAAEEFMRSLQDLPDPLGAVAGEVLADRADEDRGEASTERDLLLVDTAVDRAMFSELTDLAAKSRSAFLRGMSTLMVDIANVKTLLRARVADMPAPRARSLLFEGGSISVKELARLYALSPVEAGIRLSAVPSLRGIPLEELEDMSRLDVLADNVVVSYLRMARVVPVGPEPVIAYVMAREAEVRAVRTLLLGRLAGLPSEDLRRRLREMTY